MCGIELLGNKCAVIPNWDAYNKSNGLEVLNFEANKGFNYEEANHFPRTGKLVLTSNSKHVSDEYRIITNPLVVGNEVYFTPDAIKRDEFVEVDGEKAYVVPITSIYAIKISGCIFALSDGVLCSKRQIRNFLGELEREEYVAKYVSPCLVEYKEGYNMSNVDVNDGDSLIITSEPYEMEHSSHMVFFNEPMYLVKKNEIIGVNV